MAIHRQVVGAGPQAILGRGRLGRILRERKICLDGRAGAEEEWEGQLLGYSVLEFSVLEF